MQTQVASHLQLRFGAVKIILPKEIREYRCALMNAMYCKLVSKNLPINVECKRNHATFCKPPSLVVSIAAFHPKHHSVLTNNNVSTRN